MTPISFILNGDRVDVRDAPPTRTLLQHLREDRGLVGTKEGCAEGDCGACTVVLRRLDADGALTERAVNACIQLLPMVHGCEVVTVEKLSAGGGLHPVQRALADGHGAQCGFCTPGFVMSLWRGYEAGAPTDEESVADLLAGNLCRCTGYGPILRAAAEARRLPAAPSDRDAARARLAALGSEALDYEAADGRVWAPRNANDLAALILAHPDATIVAGATDVGLWVTKSGFRADKMIFLGACADLSRVDEVRSGLRIGAAATHADAHPPLAMLAPDLGELWRRFASDQVRSAGTVCGNIANGSPIGDGPPALIAAGAELTLRRGDKRRTMPLEDFFVDYGRQDRQPGEFVESVIIAKPRHPMDLRVYKISKRFDQDISSVLAAIHIRVEDDRVAAARIAFGGMAAIPKRAKAAEAALIGAEWGEAAIGGAIRALDDDFSPIGDHRAGAEYRMKVARNLLLKYYLERSFGDQRVTGRARATLANTQAQAPGAAK